MSCKGCSKRVLHCHSDCPDYLAFQQRQAEIKERRKQELEIHSYVTSTARRNREMRLKKQNLPNKNFINRGVT